MQKFLFIGGGLIDLTYAGEIGKLFQVWAHFLSSILSESGVQAKDLPKFTFIWRVLYLYL